MLTFMAIVTAHWGEHIAQALQVYLWNWPLSKAGGLLGLVFPVLVKQEWLHYGYALVMLIGLWLLRDGFVGRSRRWWMIAFAIQVWHHLEHFLLFVQALTGSYFFNAAAPTSLLQAAFPRLELHLFYNAVVFVPMVIAMYYHSRPTTEERSAMTCSCARRPRLATA
ncbi:hypothetical protein GCM10027290_63420 [Micromonospora sonneratiae]